jgi:hypothetical protein
MWSRSWLTAVGDAARAAGRHGDVSPGARVVEVSRRNLDRRPRAHDRRAALKLLERHVDAGVAQGVQRPVEPAGGDERPQIAELAAGVAKELQIRTRRMVVDRSFHDAEKIRFAPLEALGDDGAGLLKRQGPTKKRAKREGEAGEGLKIGNRVTHARAQSD